MKYTRDLSNYHKKLAMSIFFTILSSFYVCFMCLTIGTIVPIKCIVMVMGFI